VFLENVNVENNVIEFALARLVAQLILWELLCDYLRGPSNAISTTYTWS
jgi:hypothetical protein